MRKRTDTSSRITTSFSYQLLNLLQVCAFSLLYDRYKYIITQQVRANSSVNFIVQHN
jgi:hypothetical protein